MRVVIGRKKRHSTEEIVTKLAQADDLGIQGKPQGEIARTLGISIMTLHRLAQDAARVSTRITRDLRHESARPDARRRGPNRPTPARKLAVAASGN
jgi:hypothetical protein